MCSIIKRTITKMCNVRKNIWNVLKHKVGNGEMSYIRDTIPSIILEVYGNREDDALCIAVDPLQRGSSVILTCKLLPESNGFSIDLRTVVNNTALRVSVLINKNLIGRNFKLNGFWGSEETDTGLPFYLQADKNYEIEIFTLNEVFLIAVNGFHIAKYKHHLPYSNVNQITLHGSISDVRVVQTKSFQYPTRREKSLHFRNLVCCAKRKLNLENDNRMLETVVEEQNEREIKERKNVEFVASYKKEKENANMSVIMIEKQENKKKKSAFASFAKEERNAKISNSKEETREPTTVTKGQTKKVINVEEETDEEEEKETVQYDNDIFDREPFQNTDANENYLHLPFYGTFKKGAFKMYYTLSIQGRVHYKPHQLVVNLQGGIHVWPPPIKVLTIKIRFIRVEILPNCQRINSLMNQDNNIKQSSNIVANTNITDDCSDDDDECKLELPANVAKGLQPSSLFHIEIIRKLRCFEIFINNVLIKRTPYTTNPKLANAVFINGDFKLYDAKIICD